MINLKIYLDGNKSNNGYKYIVTDNCTSWTAFRNDNEFRYFLKTTGLKINPLYTQVIDLRSEGKGRYITARFHKRKVTECLFWGKQDIDTFSHMREGVKTFNEIPANAVSYIGLCNGSYVTCYSVINENETILYKPNPNSKSVYKPLDYESTVQKLKTGDFLK